jgi:hypothetical protein
MKTMKNLFLAGLIAVAAVITLAGCSTGNDDESDPGNALPAAKGVNAVSGKTYFENQSKTVFSATGEGASSGTYSVSETKWDKDSKQYVLDADGKYTYEERETGVYSWDETAKTVTLAPEKVAPSQNGVYSAVQTKEEYKAAQKTMLDGFKNDMGEEAFNQELQQMGFSSVAEYIEFAANEAFAQEKNAYSFSDDAAALFLEAVLPENKGTNELAGQTYNGLKWNNGSMAKDPNQVYTFNADGTYSFVDNTTGGYKEESQEGAYAVDSSQAQRKRVYLQPKKVAGKTRAAYYAEKTAYSGHKYADNAVCRAAETNDAFAVEEQPYNSANDKKTIGYEDD